MPLYIYYTNEKVRKTAFLPVYVQKRRREVVDFVRFLNRIVVRTSYIVSKDNSVSR